MTEHYSTEARYVHTAHTCKVQYICMYIHTYMHTSKQALQHMWGRTSHNNWWSLALSLTSQATLTVWVYSWRGWARHWAWPGPVMSSTSPWTHSSPSAGGPTPIADHPHRTPKVQQQCTWREHWSIWVIGAIIRQPVRMYVKCITTKVLQYYLLVCICT